MDLGATICLPKNPRCLLCPLTEDCQARALGLQDARPVLKPKANVPHRVYAAAVIIRRGRVLLAKRPSKGLLGGMWEFPNGQVGGNPARGLSKALKTGYRIDVRVGEALTPLGIIQHAYTHFRVTMHIFTAKITESKNLRNPRNLRMNENLKWVKISELENYPMGKIDRQIARKILTRQNT